jgi:hypothetical protein
MLYYHFEDPACLSCGWRDYGGHAPPIDDDGHERWAVRQGYHLKVAGHTKGGASR